MAKHRNSGNESPTTTTPSVDDGTSRPPTDEGVTLSTAPPALTMPADAPAPSSNGKAAKIGPRERFVKYRTKRLQRVEKALHSVAQFGNKQAYAMTEPERDRVLVWLERCYRSAVNKIVGATAKDEPLDPFAGLES